MRNTLFVAATMLLLAAWTPFPTTVGPEVPLDAPPLVRTRSTSPILTTHGDGALLLSIEPTVSRPGGFEQFHWVGALDENAAPAGESQFLGPIYGASAASSGRGYLVTYIENGRARAIRYSITGTRIDATPILLGTASSLSEVTWDGTAYVVVANDDAISIAEDGRILGTRDVPSLANGIESASRNGVTVFVNHRDESGVTGAMYAHVLGGATYNLGSGISADVAAGDTGFLVVSVRNSVIYGKLLDPSGAPAGEAFVITGGDRPAAVWNGTQWLVVYQTDNAVEAIRVLPGGPDGPSFTIDASGFSPTAAAKDGKVFVAWDHRFPVSTELRSATIEDDVLTRHDGVAGVISTSQSQPFLASVDGATLVAWYDGGGTRIRRMDGRSVTHTISDIGTPVAFAAGDQDALLVNRAPGAMAFTWVDRSGAAIGIQRIPWTAAVDYAAAAWIGDRWVVVWRDRRAGSSSKLVRAIVHADGTVETPRQFGSMVATNTIGLSVVGAGAKAVVLWSVDGNGGGRTLTYTIDGDGITRPGRDLGQRLHTAASRGEDVLATRALNGNLEWQRVLLDGTVAAQGKVALPAEGMTLQTFFTGENYLLLLAKAESAPNRIDLYGMRVDVTGAPIDTAPVLFTNVFTTLPPTFAGASLRGTAIDLAYFRALDEAGLYYQFPRLVVRSVHDAPRRRVVR